MRKMEEIIQYLVEQRLTGYDKELMKAEDSRTGEEIEANQEWRKFLEELDPRIRKKISEQYDRFLKLKDRELEDVYRFGVRDGILLMKNIRDVKLCDRREQK